MILTEIRCCLNLVLICSPLVSEDLKHDLSYICCCLCLFEFENSLVGLTLVLLDLTYIFHFYIREAI